MVDWDRRYREGFYNGVLEPHDLIKRFYHEIPRGVVIDIAMGTGRDAVFLSDKGYSVIGIERSKEAIKVFQREFGGKHKEVSCIIGDADFLPFKDDIAEGVTIFYFLIREIMGNIKAILKKGGILIYETFLKRQNIIDRWRNPEYLLEDGELYSYFSDFELLFYEEVISRGRKKDKVIARFVGRKI
ncbi:MAG TPA: class I SAM-dependent methyltransferase [Syntrophorhabdaceae bacterium]|nr:class I SAM-dependent methyltransferase [Syntrophorhabdaceae bacterium]